MYKQSTLCYWAVTTRQLKSTSIQIALQYLADNSGSKLTRTQSIKCIHYFRIIHWYGWQYSFIALHKGKQVQMSYCEHIWNSPGWFLRHAIKYKWRHVVNDLLANIKDALVCWPYTINKILRYNDSQAETDRRIILLDNTIFDSPYTYRFITSSDLTVTLLFQALNYSNIHVRLDLSAIMTKKPVVKYIDPSFIDATLTCY